MKTINIRFVEQACDGWGRVKEKPTYTIQQKKFLRWSTIGYWQSSYAGAVWYCYSMENKETLLNTVLEQYYKIPRSQVIIKEFPMIKYY